MAVAAEKLLPQNVEAEAGVLGSLLIDPEAIVQVADFLKPDDFYREAHRAIYQAMLDLYEIRAPADLITLCDELARRGKLEDIGGTSYVSSLANQVPTSAQRRVLRAHRRAHGDPAAADPRGGADRRRGLQRAGRRRRAGPGREADLRRQPALDALRTSTRSATRCASTSTSSTNCMSSAATSSAWPAAFPTWTR